MTRPSDSFPWCSRGRWGAKPSPPALMWVPPRTLPGTAVDEAGAPQLPDGVLDEPGVRQTRWAMQLQRRLLARAGEGGPEPRPLEVCGSGGPGGDARSFSGDGPSGAGG